MLLLGALQTGKSTLQKAMQLSYLGSLTKNERQSFPEPIFSNVCGGVRAVLQAMEILEIPLDVQERECDVRAIFMQPSQLVSMPLEVKTAIENLAYDEGFKKCLKRRREYLIDDNLEP